MKLLLLLCLANLSASERLDAPHIDESHNILGENRCKKSAECDTGRCCSVFGWCHQCGYLKELGLGVESGPQEGQSSENKLNYSIASRLIATRRAFLARLEKTSDVSQREKIETMIAKIDAQLVGQKN